MVQTLLAMEGLYFLLTGLWPLFHLKSFLAVTGPKRDLWLVQTFGVLIAAVSIPLLLAASSGQVDEPLIALGFLTAFSLMLADSWFVCQGAISRIYLVDAVVEACFVMGWLGLIFANRIA